MQTHDTDPNGMRIAVYNVQSLHPK